MKDQLVYEMKRIVANTQTVLLPMLQEAQDGIQNINYQFGHPLEIVNTLVEWSKDSYKREDKFPLVALFRPYPESRRAGQDYDTVKLNLFIIHHTNPQYDSNDRQINNFNPILLPIYHELLEQIYRSDFFVIQDPQRDMPHTRYQHDYWGNEGLYGNSGNIFQDSVDAIEIRDLELKLSPNHC